MARMEVTSRSKAVNELKSTIAVLAPDVNAAVALGEIHDMQFARRIVVRTLFAFIEGLTYQLAFLAAVSAPIEMGIFSARELASLREEARIPLKKQIKLALRCYPRIHKAAFQPNFGTKGWESLRTANDIRDRLAHPKAAADLIVSETDFQHMSGASQWYQSTVFALLEACEDADASFDRPAGA